MGLVHGLLITKAEAAAVRRDALRPADLSRRRALLHQGRDRRASRSGSTSRTLNGSPPAARTSSRCSPAGSVHSIPIPHAFFIMLVIAVIMWVVLHRSVFGRYLYAVGKNEEAARYSGIRTTRVIIAAYMICTTAGGALGDLLRHVHPLDPAFGSRQLLRALRHRGGGARRLLAPRRRGLDRRRRARHDPASGPAEPRQPARHPVVAELRGDGLGHPDRRDRRPAVRHRSAGDASWRGRAWPRARHAAAQPAE